MKSTKILSLILALCMLAGLVSCTASPAKGDALYLEDTELGTGAKTVKVTVSWDRKLVVFTLHTDAKTLGDALMEHKLIEGDEGEYGLYIKRVNGILADYDVDQTYWGFYKDGEMMLTGVDGTEIADGDAYELTRQK